MCQVFEDLAEEARIEEKKALDRFAVGMKKCWFY